MPAFGLHMHTLAFVLCNTMHFGVDFSNRTMAALSRGCVVSMVGVDGTVWHVTLLPSNNTILLMRDLLIV